MAGGCAADHDRASYSGSICLAIFVPLVLMAGQALRPYRHRRVPPGLRLPAANAQNAGYRRRFRTADPPHFSTFLRRTREHPTPFDLQPRYRSTVEDPIWHFLYLPIAALIERGTRLIAFLHRDALPSTCCTASSRR